MKFIRLYCWLRDLSRLRQKIAVVPMTGLELQKIFIRFQIGRQTAGDKLRYSYAPGMGIAQFIDVNGIDLVEAAS